MMRAIVDTPLITGEKAAPAPALRPVHLNGSKARQALQTYEGSHARTVLSIVSADLLAQATAILGAAAIVSSIAESVPFSLALGLWPIILLAMAGFALWGLYPALAIHPAEEIRRTTVVLSAVLGITLLTAYAGGILTPGLLALLAVTWALLLAAVPLFRALVRLRYAHAPWWGYPVVVLGAGPAGRRVVSTLRRQPALGLRPVAVLDDDAEQYGEMLSGVPVLGSFNLAPELALHRNVPYAVIAIPGASSAELGSIIERHVRYYKKLLVLPDLADVGSMWAASRSFDGLLGFEIGLQKKRPFTVAAKRAIDMLGALVGIILLAPFTVVVAVLMKLDSSGPVFFRQLRMGRDGRCFEVVKFRSMYVDAEQKLRDLLDENPELRYEYETFHKLRDDPRVTRVGRILRRYSLDELPQLWNVLKGDMSLVGPRAYLPAELSCMQGCERIILRTTPGVTGLWQVSGRNDVCFKTRIDMDMQYVRNRSVWLDIYILARTLPVVFTGKGAS